MIRAPAADGSLPYTHCMNRFWTYAKYRQATKLTIPPFTAPQNTKSVGEEIDIQSSGKANGAQQTTRPQNAKINPIVEGTMYGVSSSRRVD